MSARGTTAKMGWAGLTLLLVTPLLTRVVDGFVPSFHRPSADVFTRLKTGPTKVTSRARLEGRRSFVSPSASTRADDDVFLWSNDDDETRAIHETVDHDMDHLQYRIARNKVLGPGIKPNEIPPSEVNIILFYPDTDNEGVHTIEFPKGSGNNVILAFEDQQECVNFSMLLKDQQFFEPSPRDINLESLEAYCDTIGVQVQVVPRGTNLVPPVGTVDELNHRPNLHQRQSQLEHLFECDHLYEDEQIVEEGVIDAPDQSQIGAWE